MAKSPYIALTKMADEEGNIVDVGGTIFLNKALATKFSDLGLLKVVVPDDDPIAEAAPAAKPASMPPPLSGRRPSSEVGN